MRILFNVSIVIQAVSWYLQGFGDVNIVIQARRRRGPDELVREDGDAENPANALPTTSGMTNHLFIQHHSVASVDL